MTGFVLAAVPFVMKVVLGIWAVAAVILTLIVLVQKGKGGGLSSAFGGIGGSLLGTKTGDFLTWVTICIVAVWLLLSVVTAKWFRPSASEYLQSDQAPAAPVTAPAPVIPLETKELLESQKPVVNQESETGQSSTETQESNVPAGTE
jgi:preprotein translocase subunit SecG